MDDRYRPLACIVSLRVLGFMILSVVGCAATPMPAQDWQMCFASPDGEIVLATVSVEELFTGNGPIKLRTLLRTRRECRQASYDSDSGRVATVEDDGDRDVIRLYAPDSTLLGEYQCASRLRRQGVSKPCFDTGGTRIAFVCKEDAVCHADVETLNQKETVRVFRAPKVDQRSRGPHRLTCFWASDQSLVAGFDGEIYSIAANGEVKRLSSEGANQLLLCGIIGETPVGTTSDWGAWSFGRVGTNELIGKARSGHDYALLEGMSPCGEYIAYIVPGAFASFGQRYVHHLESGRRVRLDISPKWHLGSWVKAELELGRS
jgi:hypothetical protein